MGDNTITERARAAVAKSLDWLAQQDIQLDRFPTVRYIPHYHPEDSNIKASVDVESPILGRELTMLPKLYLQVLNQLTGLQASPELIEQIFAENRTRFMQHQAKQNADIQLYKPLDGASQSDLEGKMTHEVWHLVDKQYGLITDGNRLLYEGMASFVQYRYGKEHYNADWTSFEGNHTLEAYADVAKMIAHMLKEDVPLTTLLDPAIRRKISSASDKKSVEFLRRKLQQPIEDELKKLIPEHKEGVIYQGAWQGFSAEFRAPSFFAVAKQQRNLRIYFDKDEVEGKANATAVSFNIPCDAGEVTFRGRAYSQGYRGQVQIGPEPIGIFSMKQVA
ncbi:hypothetical protein C4573_02710 [Candidatus Woesearchaeota archaeon]|nr:MAG: hypothetical protein C4573_02710 [Candidatus Woesearchaeota archaeon]